MRIGIIDLGTNSVRFDVHQIGPGKRIRCLHREKLMVRLGQGVFVDGRLDPGAIRRTLHAFSSFKQTASELRVERMTVFGTAALREASDADRFITVIREKTGIDLRVISGVEEAKLIAEGILAHEKAIKPKKTYALVDIGGGSTEISICRNGRILHSESFPFGTARLQQVFLKSTPPVIGADGSDPIEELRRYVRSTLLVKTVAEGWPKPDQIIGSSGTIRALARMSSKKNSGGKSVELPELRKLVASMSTMTTKQLLEIPKMEPRRADMILAGSVLLEEIMSTLKVKKALFTEYSLRDGILHENVQVVQHNQSSSIGFHFNDFYAKAKRLGSNEAHIKQVVQLVEFLFDRLKPLHKLKSDWRQYLTAAAILHDVGEAIGPSHQEEHSYYIVKHADFPSMDKWESDFVARLCLLHKGGKTSAKDLQFKDKSRREAFLKLLALLRIAAALDRGHQGFVRIREISIARREVRLRISARSAVDLELLRIEQKKELFEAVFGRRLMAERA